MDCSESKFTVASGFTPSKATCPQCGNISKRHSIATRQVKDINLDHETTIKIKVGVYKCKYCDKHFRFQPGFVNKGKHYSKRVIEKARVAVAEDKTTFSGLKHRLARDFHVHPCKTTGYYWFHNAADKIDMEQDYEKWAVEGFSGYLAVDELYDGFAILVATDPVNDKTISVRLCKNADQKELKAFLRHLKEDLGINPKVIVTDGAKIYRRIPKQVWPKVKFQLCVFHYTRLVTKRVLEAVGCLSRKMKEDEQTKELGEKLWKARYCFVTRPENLKEGLDELLHDLCSHPDVKLIRDFMIEVFALFERDQTKEEAIEKHMRLVVYRSGLYGQNPALRKALGHLDGFTFLRAVTFLDYPDCPRTTNHVERANRFYRKRAKIHYRNRTKRSIWNMIKSDLMIRKDNYNRSGIKVLKPTGALPGSQESCRVN